MIMFHIFAMYKSIDVYFEIKKSPNSGETRPSAKILSQHFMICHLSTNIPKSYNTQKIVLG